MALITTEGRNELTALFIAMFKAAPGTTNLSEMVSAVEAGSTLAQVAAELATKTEFATVYPGFLTGEEFADRVVANLLTDATPVVAVDFATTWILGKLNAGESRSSILATAVQALRATNNTNYADAQAQLTNKVTVSNYYSITKEQSSSSLADLQDVISGVTSDTASVTTASSDIDSSVAAALGKILTLTTSIETVNGGDYNDTINGIIGTSSATLSVGDIIHGGAGDDTLVLTVAGTEATSSTVTMDGVEAVVVRDLYGASINMTGMTGVETVHFNDTVAGQTSTVTGASAATTFGLAGAGNLTVDYKAAGAASVAVSTVTAATIDVGDTNTMTSISVDTTGTNSFTLSSDTAAATLNITGDGANTITVSGLKDASTIDASTATGANTLKLGTGLGNGDTVKGGSSSSDTVEFTANAALGLITMSGIETIKGDFDADVTLNMTGIAGVKTLTSSGSSGNLVVSHAPTTLATVNLQAPATNDTNNTFSITYAEDAALKLVYGNATANQTMDSLSFNNLSSLTLNTSGAKTNTITNGVTLKNSDDANITISVGTADAKLYLNDLDNDDDGDFGNFSVTVAESGYFSGGDITADSGGFGNITLTAAKNAEIYFDGSASGDIGNIVGTIGSGACIEVYAYASGYYSAGEHGDIGNVTVNGEGDASGYIYVSANSGSIGDVHVSMHSGSVYASASGYSAVSGDDYKGGGSIGNITIMSLGNDASVYVDIEADIPDSSGITSDDVGSIGDVHLRASGDDAGISGNICGGSGGNIGNILIESWGESAWASAYVSAQEYSALDDDGNTTGDYIGGSIGNITIDVQGESASASACFSAASGGSIGDITLTAIGDGASGTISAYASGASGSDAGSVGDIIVWAEGDDAHVSAVICTYSGDDGQTIGDLHVTVVGSACAELDVYAEEQGSGNGGNVGDVYITATGDSGSSFVYIDVSGGIGDVTIDLGLANEDVCGCISAYAYSGGIGDVEIMLGISGCYSACFSADAGYGSVGTIDATVASNGDLCIYAEGESVGDITVTAGSGSDTFVSISAYASGGSLGVITLTGGSGGDTCVYASADEGGVVVNLTGWKGSYYIDISDVSGASIVNGGVSGGEIYGTDESDILKGGAGDDCFSGGAGDDVISGGACTDKFYISSTANDGGDILDGGAGTSDALYITGDTVFDAVDSNIKNIEKVYVASGVSVDLTGQTEAFTITYTGTNNDDEIIVTGGDGGDTITGGSGSDELYGGSGNDTITGGLNPDTLSGGGGDDKFKFVEADITDDVVDGGEGTDTIEFTAYVSADLGDFAEITSVEILTVKAAGESDIIAIQGTGLIKVNNLTHADSSFILEGTFDAAAAANVAAVTESGEWFFNDDGANDALLTYWDDDLAEAVTITFVGVNTGSLLAAITVDGNDDLVIAQA